MLIGDLGAPAGVSAKTIRFYEESGLLPAPPRTPGGYRDYPAAAVGRLAFIRQEHAAGLTRTRDALTDLHRRAVRTEPADCAESQICSILTPDAGG